jgi:hypothetical protein
VTKCRCARVSRHSRLVPVRTRAVACLVLCFSVGVVATGVSAGAEDRWATGATSAGHAIVLQPGRFDSAHCSAHTAIPRRGFSLGATFAGLRAAPPEYICNSSVGSARTVWGGPTISWGYEETTYGTCDASEEGCVPPLEVENAPECVRTPRSYGPNRYHHRIKGEPRLESKQLRISAAPWLPALEFDEGQRVELYTGQTTVVLFATRSSLARQAARVVAQIVAREVPSADRARISAAALGPGDGSTCHHFRSAVTP